jgi:hypothetical protein
LIWTGRLSAADHNSATAFCHVAACRLEHRRMERIGLPSPSLPVVYGMGGVDLLAEEFEAIGVEEEPGMRRCLRVQPAGGERHQRAQKGAP